MCEPPVDVVRAGGKVYGGIPHVATRAGHTGERGGGETGEDVVVHGMSGKHLSYRWIDDALARSITDGDSVQRHVYNLQCNNCTRESWRTMVPCGRVTNLKNVRRERLPVRTRPW